MQDWLLLLISLAYIGLLFAIAYFGDRHPKGWPGLAGAAAPHRQSEARRLAIHVERAAARLPWGALCLPRAIALSALLKNRNIPHQVVIAIRPAGQRGEADALHAWIDCGGIVVLGALEGPWHELARLP